MKYQYGFVLFFLIWLEVIANGDSPPLTLKVKKIGNSTYYVEEAIQTNWFKAQLFCGQHGMELASIQNEKEGKDLAAYIKSLSGVNEKAAFWLSGSDYGQEGEWVWFTLGQKIGWGNWALGKATNYKANCLFGRLQDNDLKWIDSWCGSRYLFICEKKQCTLDDQK